MKAVPYGEGGMKHKGLVLCPIHAALFAAHLISFSDRGKVLVSPSVTEEEKNNLVLRREWTRGILSAEGVWRSIAEF